MIFYAGMTYLAVTSVTVSWPSKTIRHAYCMITICLYS